MAAPFDSEDDADNSDTTVGLSEIQQAALRIDTPTEKLLEDLRDIIRRLNQMKYRLLSVSDYTQFMEASRVFKKVWHRMLLVVVVVVVLVLLLFLQLLKCRYISSRLFVYFLRTSPHTLYNLLFSPPLIFCFFVIKCSCP